jgi:hypothetical protein
VVLYDPQTRSELQNSQPFPSKDNKRDALVANVDGSIELYLGPAAPAGAFIAAGRWSRAE